MTLSEAEIQVLASLTGAESEKQATDQASIEAWGKERYWDYCVDWAGAFASLTEGSLIEGTENGYSLTDQGRPLAEGYFNERPDYYWYYFQRLYDALATSKAHKKFRAHVTGIDYSASAVSVATARTEAKRDRLEFREGNMDDLDLPQHSFDAAYSIDSIYWVADMANVIGRIIHGVKPGGKLAIVITQIADYCEEPGELELHGTPPAQALQKLELEYEGIDLTGDALQFWPRYKEAVVALQDEFVQEGNAFICENYLKEVNTEILPAIEANEYRRYLYVATSPQTDIIK